jgi:hypothetical protein
MGQQGVRVVLSTFYARIILTSKNAKKTNETDKVEGSSEHI